MQDFFINSATVFQFSIIQLFSTGYSPTYAQTQHSEFLRAHILGNLRPSTPAVILDFSTPKNGIIGKNVDLYLNHF